MPIQQSVHDAELKVSTLIHEGYAINWLKQTYRLRQYRKKVLTQQKRVRQLLHSPKLDDTLKRRVRVITNRLTAHIRIIDKRITANTMP
jgi:hypothetical protein